EPGRGRVPWPERAPLRGARRAARAAEVCDERTRRSWRSSGGPLYPPSARRSAREGRVQPAETRRTVVGVLGLGAMEAKNADLAALRINRSAEPAAATFCSPSWAERRASSPAP